MARYILGIDHGTTFTKAMIFDHDAKIVSSAMVKNRLYFPQPGWVEQDPDEIFSATLQATEEAFKNSRITPDDIEAIGISNQLLTTIFWNKHTGEAVGRALMWQDNRTLPICERLISLDQTGIELRTGMHIIPNCSATKIRWLIENDRAIQKGLARSELLFGTVDTWLVWKLSGGAVHVTDLSNAGLTLLLNTHTLSYDEWMLRTLDIPVEILPDLRSSSEIYAYTSPEVFFDTRVPIAGVAGDQFAAAFGQGCQRVGTLSCNLGTGSSLILNIGDRVFSPAKGLDLPILWAVDDHVARGIGSWTNVSGAAIQWLRDELGIIHDETEAEVLATRVSDSLGVYFVPAFTGLGNPHADAYSRGTLFGITQGTTKGHLVRAALEAMAYQLRDAFEEMVRQSDVTIGNIRVGGGNAKNEFLMQFLADILGIVVERPAVIESSSLGAAFLAGLATGFWDSTEEVQSLVWIERHWEPNISLEKREMLYRGWKKAISRSLGWLKE